MNYITSCPECNTQFLLSEEHLKAHRGKVQCGHCDHVFNAKNRLSRVSDESDELMPPPDGKGDSDSPAAAISAPAVADNTQTLKAPTQQPKAEAKPAPDIEAEQTRLPHLGGNTNFQPTNNSYATPIEIEDLTAAPAYKATRKKSRFSAILLAFLLLLGAAAQAIYYLRSPIAAQYPQLKPLLAEACVQIGCTVNLPQNLELLLIDDSDMQQDETREGVINFSSTLINHANYAQAYPNIELTLTNADDQVVIKSLIKPAQYLKAGTPMEVGIAAQQELNVKLALSASAEAVTGYRVQLAY